MVVCFVFPEILMKCKRIVRYGAQVGGHVPGSLKSSESVNCFFNKAEQRQSAVIAGFSFVELSDLGFHSEEK